MIIQNYIFTKYTVANVGVTNQRQKEVRRQEDVKPDQTEISEMGQTREPIRK